MALEPFIEFKVFLYNSFNIARFILYKGPIKADITRKNCTDFSEQYLKIQHNRLNNHLKLTKQREKRAENALYQIRRIKALAKKDSVPLVIALIPDENQIRSQKPLLSRMTDVTEYFTTCLEEKQHAK